MRWVEYVACIEIMIGKAERNRPLGIIRCRWDYNIRKYLLKMGWEIVN
jgi:hypothetical protein